MRALGVLLVLCAAPVDAACRQALAIGLDVSGSVDAAEYRLQVNGLAAALSRPAVREALLQFPDAPVDLAVFEWSGPQDTRIILGWTTLSDPARIDGAAGLLRATERGISAPSTAIGSALRAGAALLDERPDCWRRVLDLSGDGKSNTGPRPREVRPSLESRAITVNALVVGAGVPASGDERSTLIGELTAYFRAEVIVGPGAFIETALGYDDYADAMERKLMRELRVPAIGLMPAPGPAPFQKAPAEISRYSGSGRSSTVRRAAASN